MAKPVSVHCPVCQHTHCQPVYKCNAVPIHSVRLARSAEAAMAIARGDIELYHCLHCSMVWNQAFDHTQMQYDAHYEETQGFSVTFQAFHQWLAGYLVDQYALQGKTVLEIGCGKGEFLLELVDRGVRLGLGFDPAFDESRIPLRDNLVFFREFFPPVPPPSPALSRADFYICKMTLEHIHQPRGFLQQLRDYIGDHDAPIAIQVPALERIIDECAYWDIYYEHCHYFNEQSLTSLLELSGFSVIEVSRIFDGQYLNLIARPGTTRPTFAPILNQSIEHFARTVSQNLSIWRDFLAPAAQQKSLLIWGAASKAVALLSAIPELKSGIRLVDINPHKQRTCLASTEIKIESPEGLQDQCFDLILVANPVYLNEIREQLTALNISGRSIPLGNLPPAINN